MNIYDQANALGRGLKESEEYQNFLKAKQAIDGDEQAKKMVHEFIAKQMEIEYEKMSGKEEDKTKMEQLQKLYAVIAYHHTARDFLDTYMKFQRMMSDIYKIIGESISEGMNFFAKQ